MSAEELGEKVGLKAKMIYQGEAKSNFSRAVLINIAKVFDDNLGLLWLEPYLSREGSLRTIPLVGCVAAGEPCEAIEWQGMSIDMAETELVGITNPVALKVAGDSMKGLHILNNDIVIVEESARLQNRIVAAYVIAEGRHDITLKVWKQRGKTLELRPANPKHKSQVYTPQSKVMLEAFGVVRKVLRTYDYSKPLEVEEFVDEQGEEVLVV